MKRVILVVSLFLLCVALPTTVLAYTDTINLGVGWNVVSTPQVLASHSFSAEEISDNFDIYILDASSTAGWSTLAGLGQSEFIPLYGYFINNKTTSTQQLAFVYSSSTAPNERLFEREFVKQSCLFQTRN